MEKKAVIDGVDRSASARSASPYLSKLSYRLFPAFQKLGPGIVTGAADDDPSGIATYSRNSVGGNAAGSRIEFCWNQSNQGAFLERRDQRRDRRTDHVRDDADDGQQENHRLSPIAAAAKDSRTDRYGCYVCGRSQHDRYPPIDLSVVR
jgi:hypothetical protein